MFFRTPVELDVQNSVLSMLNKSYDLTLENLTITAVDPARIPELSSRGLKLISHPVDVTYPDSPDMFDIDIPDEDICSHLSLDSLHLIANHLVDRDPM